MKLETFVYKSDEYEEEEEGEDGEEPKKRKKKKKEVTEEPAPPPVEEKLSPEALALKKELERIFVVAPDLQSWQELRYDTIEFPDSYKHNSPKEELALSYAENFRRQYVHLYRDRKSLLLNPVNECGLEKLVCTTLRPTQLPYISLYNWDGCADFVADYLNFEPLNPPVDLPARLRSPMTVLKQQRGHCFEYANVLCSLLIAQGYDAYIVSGYATREICLMDSTREICPLLIEKKEEKVEEKKKEVGKYTVRPPKDLKSKYEAKMSKRADDNRLAEIKKKQEEEEQKLAELEKPAWDPLHGLRVHAWVLVLEGKREISESFYIEPFTGQAYSLTTKEFHGIESIWNHQNYWVNMQLCKNGVVDLKFDLGDCSLWEFMFPSSDKPLLSIPDLDEDLDIDDEDEEEDVEKHLDVPPSWCDPIEITYKEFESRCPLGKKTKYYKRAKLERFAPYLMKDGLVARLSVYNDYELKDINLVKEFFENREDHLYLRIHNMKSGWVTEYFLEGRSHAVKEHTYLASSPGAESERVMLFYNEARVDGLSKREETPLEMTEHFQNREDFLYYQHIDLGPKPKKAGPKGSDLNPRPIYKMVQKFARNLAKDANEDVKELVYWISEEKIQITYHTGDPKIISSTREYMKPPGVEEKGSPVIMTADMHSTFQVDPASKGKKNLDLYQLLCQLLKDEDACCNKVRESEAEVRTILKERLEEETRSLLKISVYDTDRNERAKKHRRELERQLLEEKMRREEMEVDFLAPFLAQMGDPEKLTKEQAFTLKDQCLADLKQRLIDKANLIQARFEKETAELTKKQQWYQQNQVSMLKDDEEDYVSYCTEAMFKIHILELRLQRHKEKAPYIYMELDKKLRADRRLSEYLTG
ncbi:CCDC135 [Bugula neritina]|uniref:Dynein regulatory complex subunit 7 n=1 Tax=Bugula neritina TaxID=10212 RepID=A0A7J7J5P7_BUGNE|nr:CCDC135 [Bugula neritina]